MQTINVKISLLLDICIKSSFLNRVLRDSVLVSTNGVATEMPMASYVNGNRSTCMLSPAQYGNFFPPIKKK